MAQAGGAVAPPNGGGPQQMGIDWRAALQQMMQTIMIVYLVQTLSKSIFEPPKPERPSDMAKTVHPTEGPGSAFGNAPLGRPNGPIWLIFREHDLLDLYVFMTESEDFDYERDKGSLIWSQKRLSFDWESGNDREVDLNVTVTPHMQNNGSVWGHALFTRHGIEPNKANRRTQFFRTFAMNRYRKRRKNKNLKSLLDDAGSNLHPNSTTSVNGTATPPPPTSNSSSSNDAAPEVVSYWKPSFDVNLVHHFVDYGSVSYIPPHVLNFMDIEDGGGYYPIIYLNEFWLLNERMIPLNDTISQVPLHLSFAPIGFFKWQIQLQMENHFKVQQQMGYSSEGEADMIRQMFLDTNPILLGVTMVVSVFHMLFDMLAFKADVTFWRSKKSLEGMSLRMIVVNTFFQLVIFLYLADNDTSWMVLFSSGMGVLIEFWKIKKAVQTSLIWEDPVTKKPYRIPRLHMKPVDSYTKTRTQEFDEIATSHLLYIVMPLMVGYAAYSLVHERHKGWYSWIVSSLTSFVYIFGFVMMTPQLFINYKLRSVAHLPWRAMVYKSLNTFIDDLFAFIIKMPTMHRLSCFRDDIIFFIYLYQRWIYPVDKTRVNEFGQVTEDNKDSEEARQLISTNLSPQDKQRLGLVDGSVDEVLDSLDSHQDKEALCTLLRATTEASMALKIVSELSKMPLEDKKRVIQHLLRARNSENDRLTSQQETEPQTTTDAHDVD